MLNWIKKYIVIIIEILPLVIELINNYKKEIKVALRIINKYGAALKEEQIKNKVYKILKRIIIEKRQEIKNKIRLEMLKISIMNKSVEKDWVRMSQKIIALPGIMIGVIYKATEDIINNYRLYWVYVRELFGYVLIHIYIMILLISLINKKVIIKFTISEYNEPSIATIYFAAMIIFLIMTYIAYFIETELFTKIYQMGIILKVTTGVYLVKGIILGKGFKVAFLSNYLFTILL